MLEAPVDFMPAGASGYDQDDGWFLGRDGGEPALSIRAGGDYLRYKPSTGLEFRGQLNERGSFSAELTGFTTTENVTIEYQRIGIMTFLWLDSNEFATSNSSAMRLQYVPSALRPPTSRQCIQLVRDNGSAVLGRCSLGSSGEIIFDLSPFTGGGFTSSGSKGLFAGWQLSYALDP